MTLPEFIAEQAHDASQPYNDHSWDAVEEVATACVREALERACKEMQGRIDELRNALPSMSSEQCSDAMRWIVGLQDGIVTTRTLLTELEGK